MKRFYFKVLCETFIRRHRHNKLKVLFRLNGGYKNEQLLNSIFPIIATGTEWGGTKKNCVKKETEKSVSIFGGTYTPCMVPLTGLGPVRFLHRGIFSLLYVAIAVISDVVVRTLSLP